MVELGQGELDFRWISKPTESTESGGTTGGEAERFREPILTFQWKYLKYLESTNTHEIESIE